MGLQYPVAPRRHTAELHIDGKNTCSKSVWIWKNTISKLLTVTNHTFCSWEYREGEFYIEYMNMNLWFEVSEKTIGEKTGFGFCSGLVVCGFGGFVGFVCIFLRKENENGNS